jgi:hypothetical protein
VDNNKTYRFWLGCITIFLVIGKKHQKWLGVLLFNFSTFSAISHDILGGYM